MTTSDYAGLSTAEVEERFKKYGLNDVVEKRSGEIKKFLAPLYSPISLMLLAAAGLSYANSKIFDFYFILALYFVNYSIQKWQEFKADRAIQELQAKLSFDVSTFRDDRWGFVNAKQLLPGDRVRMGLGSIIPADGTISSANNLTVNEAVLTGESMPKEKKIGDKVYSGSFISTGSLEADVTATGKNTNFGKTIFSIEPAAEKSIMEKDVLSITRFLTGISIVSVIILTFVLASKGFAIEDLLTLDLSLIIAGIPIALPVVMAVILSIGAAGLAKKLVVVRRLSALQDLANVNLLLTDKTGTLTKNQISITDIISYREDLDADRLIELARYAASPDTPDTIDLAIIKRFDESGQVLLDAEMLGFTPYDSERKRTTAYIQKGDEKTLLSFGAPQVILALSGNTAKDVVEKFERDISTAAAEGFRVLALSRKSGDSEEMGMEIIGAFFLSDSLDESSADTLHFMQEQGINVKMVTGDNKIIAERIANELDLPGKVLLADEARKLYGDADAFRDVYGTVGVFAEILPKDKYEIVKAFKAEGYIVASTGDGINDLPALKVANVGIAVSNAVSALKSLADIVLLGQGIAVIQDAILESRKIFVRLYNYSVYRISESFRLIITILLLGIGYGFYPLVPLQLILLAFLNDIPIISLAVDRVKISTKPSEIKAKQRLALSLLFGSVGVLNSLGLFFLMMNIWHLPLAIMQTMFFLKLTVSGHMLIFVAHTKERWYKFLPSREVIIATLGTQAVATTLAVTGFMMPTPISLGTATFVWAWAFFWMQVSEGMKDLQAKFVKVS